MNNENSQGNQNVFAIYCKLKCEVSIRNATDCERSRWQTNRLRADPICPYTNCIHLCPRLIYAAPTPCCRIAVYFFSDSVLVATVMRKVTYFLNQVRSINIYCFDTFENFNRILLFMCIILEIVEKFKTNRNNYSKGQEIEIILSDVKKLLVEVEGKSLTLCT